MTLGALKRFIRDNFELLWRYRFFNRETVALLNADQALSERHAAISKERFARQRLLLRQAVQERILLFSEPETRLDEVLAIVWVIANHYLIHLESMGQKVEQSDFETGAELVMKVLYPYMKLTTVHFFITNVTNGQMTRILSKPTDFRAWFTGEHDIIHARVRSPDPTP